MKRNKKPTPLEELSKEATNIWDSSYKDRNTGQQYYFKEIASNSTSTVLVLNKKTPKKRILLFRLLA
ncbi:MAG: hypothetical protein QXX68_02925 [Candidatus Pacearchaeota archaeon]